MPGVLKLKADSYHIYGRVLKKPVMIYRLGNELSIEEGIYNFYCDYIRKMYNDAEAMMTGKSGNLITGD